MNAIVNVTNNDEKLSPAMKKSMRMKEITFPEYTDANIRSKISKALICMGVSPSCKGFGYIVDIIEGLRYAMTTNQISKITDVRLCDAYQSVGIASNENWQAVERAIRYSVENVFEKGNQKLLDKIYGYSVSLTSGKVPNKTFLYGLYNYLFEFGCEEELK